MDDHHPDLRRDLGSPVTSGSSVGRSFLLYYPSTTQLLPYETSSVTVFTGTSQDDGGCRVEWTWIRVW